MESIRLEVKNGLKFYVSGREITLALHDINVHFSMGEFVTITGESGSGKSTLAHILAGIFSCDKGELLLNRKSTAQYGEEDWEKYRRDKISFIAQNYGILPGNTVFDNVVSALRLAGMDQKEAAGRAEHLLRQVELWKWRRRRAARLSSGQKQRLSIARALAKPAPILIADEPTSNLDWGNSSRIIGLLAEAAKDRLVIVVTHNFEAMKEYATRHIVMRDGVIVSDEMAGEEAGSKAWGEGSQAKSSASQRKSEGSEAGQPDSKYRQVSAASAAPKQGDAHQAWKKQRRLAPYIAKLQLKARPIWTIVAALLFSLTAFAVFAFLGTFFVSLDDTNTRIYNNEAFRNGNERRLVVIREDGQPFEEQDYDKLLAVPWTEALQRYDNLLDVNYYYRPNVDFVYRYFGEAKDMYSELVYKTSVLLKNHTQYVQTVPLLAEGRDFLAAGRLPEHMDEVVAAGGVELLGTSVPVYLLDYSLWGEDSFLYEEMTVVGVTDYGSGLYFDDRIGQTLWQTATCTEILGNIVYGADRQLTGNEMMLTEGMEKRFVGPGRVKETITIGLPDLHTGDVVELHSVGTNLSQMLWYISMSEEMFDELSLDIPCTQVSVFLTDYSYTDRAIRAIEELGYEAISPYRVGSVAKNEEKARERMTTLVLCLAALCTVIVAQAVVLAAMFGTQMQGYAQLCSMGLACRTGQYSVFWQVLFLTVAGQLLGGAAIFLGADKGIARLVDLVKYLEPPMVAVLSLVHVAAAALVAFAVSMVLRHKVFPFLKQGYDVDLNELEAEEEEEA